MSKSGEGRRPSGDEGNWKWYQSSDFPKAVDEGYQESGQASGGQTVGDLTDVNPSVRVFQKAKLKYMC